MKLQQIFDQLTYGELSQLSIGGLEPGVISETNWDRVIPHINLALTALFSRFPLKQGELTLQLMEDVQIYTMSSRFAVNGRGHASNPKFILDTAANKFKDDVLKIEQVFTDDDYELSLNNLIDPFTLTTPSMTSLKVPTEILTGSSELPDKLKTENLRVVYRANCNPVVRGLGYFDPAQYEVELPISHLQALVWFVASRIHNPVGMVNEFHAGNSYAAKYEAECAQLEISNLKIDQGSQNEERLYAKGFV